MIYISGKSQVHVFDYCIALRMDINEVVYVRDGNSLVGISGGNLYLLEGFERRADAVEIKMKAVDRRMTLVPISSNTTLTEILQLEEKVEQTEAKDSIIHNSILDIEGAESNEYSSLMAKDALEKAAALLLDDAHIGWAIRSDCDYILEDYGNKIRALIKEIE